MTNLSTKISEKITFEGAEDIPTAPDAEMSKYIIVRELKEMEKRAVQEDFLFAGTPVIYRTAR